MSSIARTSAGCPASWTATNGISIGDSCDRRLIINIREREWCNIRKSLSDRDPTSSLLPVLLIVLLEGLAVVPYAPTLEYADPLAWCLPTMRGCLRFIYSSPIDAIRDVKRWRFNLQQLCVTYGIAILRIREMRYYWKNYNFCCYSKNNYPKNNYDSLFG